MFALAIILVGLSLRAQAATTPSAFPLSIITLVK